MTQILTFSSLYPSSSRPTYGLFVEHRLRKLVATGRIGSTVVCPVPWFFSTNPRFGRFARLAATPTEDVRHGIRVHYPRFFLLPRLGMQMAPRSMLRATRGLVARLHAEQRFAAIDAHYFYPDGIAAAMLGEELGLPVVITARGTDVNLLPKYDRPREQILWAAAKARHVITVSHALKNELVKLGASADKITVLRNGVDLEMFRPTDRNGSREKYGATGPTLLSVGNLVPLKGHDIVISALVRLPGVTLLIAGDGPERARLQAQVASLGLDERVRFLGEVPQHALVEVYSAADALVLASSREGWANVLLEAMACGTPVIATDVAGNPEIVSAPAAGVLMAARSPEGLVDAYQRLLVAAPSRSETRRYAESFDWEHTTRGQLEIFGALARSTPAL